MNPDIKYLLSLRAIRERAQIVWRAAEAGELVHFDFHADKLHDVADFVISTIQVHLPFTSLNIKRKIMS